jgi:hypothetical protein
MLDQVPSMHTDNISSSLTHWINLAKPSSELSNSLQGILPLYIAASNLFFDISTPTIKIGFIPLFLLLLL